MAGLAGRQHGPGGRRRPGSGHPCHDRGGAGHGVPGPTLASRISNASLERVILVLLVVIGTALIVESFLPTETAALIPAAAWPVAAFILGLAIGLVSSLLGVAGGELIIPSLSSRSAPRSRSPALPACW